jgi:hypothetical protein
MGKAPEDWRATANPGQRIPVQNSCALPLIREITIIFVTPEAEIPLDFLGFSAFPDGH